MHTHISLADDDDGGWQRFDSRPVVGASCVNVDVDLDVDVCVCAMIHVGQQRMFINRTTRLTKIERCDMYSLLGPFYVCLAVGGS